MSFTAENERLQNKVSIAPTSSLWNNEFLLGLLPGIIDKGLLSRSRDNWIAGVSPESHHSAVMICTECLSLHNLMHQSLHPCNTLFSFMMWVRTPQESSKFCFSRKTCNLFFFDPFFTTWILWDFQLLQFGGNILFWGICLKTRPEVSIQHLPPSLGLPSEI